MQTFCKISCNDDEDYFLLTSWKDDGKEGFDLTITDSLKAWKTSVSGDNLDELAEQIHMKYFEYIAQTKAALTASSFDQTVFVYQVKRKDHKLEFIWKKFLATENIKFQLGLITLTEVNDSAPIIKNIFSFCCREIQDFQKNLQIIKGENEQLSIEKTDALKRLEKCVIAKEENERFLFSKFASILNEKKAKIRGLKANGVESDNSNSNRKKRKVPSSSEADKDASSCRIPEMRKSSSEDDDDSDDTDIDEQPILETIKSSPRKPLNRKRAASSEESEADYLVAPKGKRLPNVPKKSSMVLPKLNQISCKKNISKKSSQQLNLSSDIDDLLEKL